MSREYLTIGVVTVLVFHFSSSAARCEDRCDGILQGVYTKLHFKNSSEFQAAVKKAFELSETERSDIKNNAQASGNFNYLYILSGAFTAGEQSEATRNLAKLLLVNEDIAWSSREYKEFTMQFADKEVIKSWRECIIQELLTEQRGVKLLVSGNVKGDFIVNLAYLPIVEGPKELVIRSAKFTGADPVGELDYRKGETLKNYAGISQILRRMGRKR